MSTTRRSVAEDLQETRPTAPISLSSAGVTRSAKAIRISHNGTERLFQAEIMCFCDLRPDQKGAHMSRFEEDVNEAIDEVVIGQALRIEALAERIAESIIRTQRALRSEVTIRASYPVERRTPVTDIATQEMYGLIGIAAANPTTSRRLVGVTAQGMNACPCAQGLIRAQAEDDLRADGFTDDEIDRIVALVPVATHNQRARGTLYLGAPSPVDIDADRLIEIVEDGMSSEIYELMKRPDEQYVVDRAHRRPRFVEDSVREMIRGALETFPDLPDDAFVHAHQANFETIHTHDVEAERSGSVGEIREEMRDGTQVARHTTLRAWLDGGVPRGADG
jgi:GTP cyclohydrolase I/GTP cyclohydrolase-4